jgi:hypothetical protein
MKRSKRSRASSEGSGPKGSEAFARESSSLGERSWSRAPRRINASIPKGFRDAHAHPCNCSGYGICMDPEELDDLLRSHEQLELRLKEQYGGPIVSPVWAYRAALEPNADPAQRTECYATVAAHLREYMDMGYRLNALLLKVSSELSARLDSQLHPHDHPGSEPDTS